MLNSHDPNRRPAPALGSKIPWEARVPRKTIALVTDATGRIESASPSAEATLGKVTGQRCVDVVDARGLDGTTVCTQTCAASCTDGTPAVEVRVKGKTWRMYCAGAGPHRTVTLAPTGEDIDGLPPLSPREKEVLILVAAGLTNARIARRLDLSRATVRTHIEHILSKLRVRSRSAAVARAMASGMLEG